MKDNYHGSHDSDGEKKPFQSFNYEDFQADVQSSQASIQARNRLTRKYVIEMWEKLMRERGSK